VSTPRLPIDTRAQISRRAREQFVANIQAALAPMTQAIRGRLSELSTAPGASREMQDRRDALLDFERKGVVWAQGTGRAWQKALVPPTATARVKLEMASMELIGDEVVERKILSSRLAQAIIEKASWDLNDLKVRMQYLEGDEDLASTDVLRPEALAQMLVEQWFAAELSRDAWMMVQDVIHKHVMEHVPKAYTAINEYLVGQGVMRDIDLSTRVKRAARSGGGGGHGTSAAAGAASGPGSDFGRSAPGGGYGDGGDGMDGGGGSGGGGSGGGGSGGGGSGGGGSGGGAAYGSAGAGGGGSAARGGAARGSSAGGAGPRSGAPGSRGDREDHADQSYGGAPP
jgi:hypothetical protein